MYNFKKFVAFGMAAAMVLGSSLTAFATEGTAVEITGAGTPAFVDKDVFSITVPTGDAITKTLAFTVDPYGVVAEAHADKKVEPGAGVLFAKAAGGDYDYAATSDALTITNKSAIGVTIAVEAKVVAGSATYAGNYSTTPDFSGGATADADASTGLYFGLQSDNELDKALDTTGVTFTNAVVSAADQYAVTESSGAYTYALKSGAEDFPTYKFAVTAALNPDVAETTWYSISDKVKTAKTMPSLSLKFTPSGIRECKPATIVVEGENVYISKTTEDGGFGTTKPTAILVNGKSIATVSDNEEGYVKVTWKDIYTAWGYTEAEIKKLSEAEQDVIWNGASSFKVTVGGIDYYAEAK